MWLRKCIAALAAIVLTAVGITSPALSQPATDQVCVEGTVIDHAEQSLGIDWEIVATPYTDGSLDPTAAVTVTTNVDGEFLFGDGLTPGQWQFSITIDDPDAWEPITPAVFNVELSAGEAACTVIRFKLRRIIPVDVLKVDDNYVPLAGWTIIARPGPGNFYALPTTVETGDDGTAHFRLTPGLWVFTEKAPAGVRYVPVIPLNGTLSVVIGEPGPYVLRFKNRIFPDGCIIATKLDDPLQGVPFPVPGWRIEVRRADGSVAASGATDVNGEIRFERLPFGPYTVVEETRVGWRPKTPATVPVLLENEDCETVEFVNEQEPPGFVIVGYKIDTNGKVGLPGWEITATPLDQGGYEPQPAETDGSGRFEFVLPADDYRIPGSHYRVCEVMQDGWLPHTPICQNITLPKWPGPPVRLKPFENQQVGHWEATHNPPCSRVHIVVKGQTWTKVARMYHVSLRALFRANPTLRSRYLYKYIGLPLCVP